MKEILSAVVVPCVKATELIEKKRHYPLTKAEKVQLNTHLALCKACSNYTKQAAAMDRLLKKYTRISAPVADTRPLEERILKQIQK